MGVDTEKMPPTERTLPGMPCSLGQCTQASQYSRGGVEGSFTVWRKCRRKSEGDGLCWPQSHYRLRQ